MSFDNQNSSKINLINLYKKQQKYLKFTVNAKYLNVIINEHSSKNQYFLIN